MTPKDNLPVKQVILILSGVIYFVAGLAVTQLHSKPIGLLMLSPFFVFLTYAIIKMPKEEAERIGLKLEERKKSLLGKYGFLILALVFALMIIVKNTLMQ